MNKGINVRQGESLNPLTLPTSRAIVKPTMLYTFPSAAYGQLKLGDNREYLMVITILAVTNDKTPNDKLSTVT